MSNSYKDRIKGHQVNTDAEAWNQMRELLDHSSEKPTVVPKYSYRNRLFLLLSLLLFLITMSYILYTAKIDSEHSVSSNPDDIENLIESEVNSIGQAGTIETAIVVQSLPVGDVQHNAISESTINSQRAPESNNAESKEVNNGLSQSMATSNKIIEDDRGINYADAYSTQQVELRESVLNDVGDKSIVENYNNTISDVDKNSELKNKIDVISTVPSLGLFLDKSEKIFDDSPIDIATFDNKKLSIYALGGFARFNQNNGYHVGTGLVYDANKLLGFETHIAYSRGSDRNKSLASGFEFEQQLELGLLIHLKLFNIGNLRSSIIGGPTYVFYNGQRLIFINSQEEFDIRRSNGWGGTFGLDMNYDLDRRTAIGFRLNAISLSLIHISEPTRPY